MTEKLEHTEWDRSTVKQLQKIAIMSDASEMPCFDVYRKNEKVMLEKKIRTIYCPELILSKDQQKDNNEIKFGSGSKKTENYVRNMVDTIWNQSKYTDGVLKMQIVYIALVDENNETPRETVDYTLHPIFRIMKCVDFKTKSSKDKCMIFVDKFGRVYQNWEKFKSNNIYPKAQIVAPTKGWYCLPDNKDLDTEMFFTPACSPLSRLIKHIYAFAGFCAIPISLMLTISCFVPFTAPLMWSVNTILTGLSIIGGLKAAATLYDNAVHEQLIGFNKPESVAQWFSLLGSVLGIVSGAFTKVVKQITILGWSTKLAVQFATGLNIMSMSVNGMGIYHGLIILIGRSKNEKPKWEDWAQVTMSLSLFTHSVYNYQSVSEVVRQEQDKTIDDLIRQEQNEMNELNSRIDRLTQRYGPFEARRDVIRSLRPNHHHTREYFELASSISKSLLTLKTLKLLKPVVKMVESMTILKYNASKIKEKVPEHTFNQLFNIAVVITKHYEHEMLELEHVLYEAYDLYCKHGSEKQLNEFKNNYETIPKFIRDHFAPIRTLVGPIRCSECCGRKF